MSAGSAAQARTTPQKGENGAETRYHRVQEAQYQAWAAWRQAKAAAPASHAAQQAWFATRRPWKHPRKYDRRYSDRKHVRRITIPLISPWRFNRYTPVSRNSQGYPHSALTSWPMAGQKPRWISPWVSQEDHRRSLVPFSTQVTRTAAPSTMPRAERSSDARLMLQIGQLLGLAYLAFLAVWFWATRFRTRPYRGARV